MAKKIIALPRSPLAEHEAVEHADYRQAEVSPLGKIIIRGKSSDEGFVAAIKSVLKAELPLVPNRSTRIGNNMLLLWLGPEEWLLWIKDNGAQKKLAALKQALAEQYAAVVDVSDYYTVIRLSGDKARQVLAHGCPLDLRDNRFAVGSCAQSHYCGAAVLLYRSDEGFDVQVRWSYAQYLWQYFARVGATVLSLAKNL